jgi:hypothetical protein
MKEVRRPGLVDGLVGLVREIWEVCLAVRECWCRL